jgi:glucose-fructose oxidoreductase
MVQANKRKIRYAVVGLGWFAQTAILPGFAQATDNSELVALVSGDPDKARDLGDKYKVPVYPYGEFDRLLKDENVDAIYIALANSKHYEFTVRAAHAGVHVLCEKPMAVTPDECRLMINACSRNKVRLMIAYRLHFDDANLQTIEVVRSGRIGEPRIFTSMFTQQVESGNFPLDAEMGGGPLGDVGIYCVNAARYLFRDEPTEVAAFAARKDETRFDEVPEMLTAIMRFPKERVAMFTCGFGEAKVDTFQVVGTKGDVRLEMAYAFLDERKQIVTVDGKSEERTFPKRDQIAPEILYFSDCVLTGREPEPSGVEGLTDVRILKALGSAYGGGKPVPLQPFPVKGRPSLDQVIKWPGVNWPPDLVKAAPPGGKKS